MDGCFRVNILGGNDNKWSKQSKVEILSPSFTSCRTLDMAPKTLSTRKLSFLSFGFVFHSVK